MNKIPMMPVKMFQSYMTWSAWSRCYVTVRQLYALVG